MDEQRMDRIEKNLEEVSNHLRQFDLVMTAKMQELDERLGNRVSDLVDHQVALSEQQRAFGEHQLALQSSLQSLVAHVDGLDAKLSELSDNQILLDAALKSLIEQIDRFLRGQGGDGR